VLRTSARDRILEQGLRLACTGGLCRVTFGAIARHAHLSKSGIVAHFSNADNLKAAIVVSADSSGVAELRRYIGRWINWTTRAGLPGGCPIASALFEYNYEQGSARAAVEAAEALWRETLIDLIKDAVADSGFSHRIDPSQMAWNLLGVYLTHHVSAHLLRAPDADRRALESVGQLIAFARRANS
jgi:AcrR family transcriptional regulator